jgi:AraC family transcriptional regulator
MTFLNKPATGITVIGQGRVGTRRTRTLMTARDIEWSPRWYLWDGGFLAVGRSRGVVPPHSHHAVQIALPVDGTVRIADASGEWRACPGAIVRPDVTHSFDGCGTMGAMLFVDPESLEGLWLRASLMSDITVVPETRLLECTEPLRTFAERPLEALDAASLVRHCVEALCAGPPPSRRLDTRVTRVLQAVHASDDLRLSLDDAAARVFLSPGRFAHLFTEHVGLPFRRYMLWRKLTRAMVAVGRGGSLSQAAHAAGFADSAHLTRTFNQMFGIPPSVMLQGEFFEIDPPFQLADA